VLALSSESTVLGHVTASARVSFSPSASARHRKCRRSFPSLHSSVRRLSPQVLRPLRTRSRAVGSTWALLGANTSPTASHISLEPFPPSVCTPTMRPAFAQAHRQSNISSYEPKSSEPIIFTSHTAAQLIRSPQFTTSLLLQISSQDAISAPLGMPPSRTISVASSQR
jgi:hypothetical protein